MTASRRPPGRQRGITLVESLIAFLVLSLGMLAVVRLQPALRQHAEVARQRSEAVRLAQLDIERQRGLVRLDGADAFAAITSGSEVVPADAYGSPRYEIERAVATEPFTNLRSIRVTVRWTARDGRAQQLELATLIAGSDPALAGALLLPR